MTATNKKRIGSGDEWDGQQHSNKKSNRNDAVEDSSRLDGGGGDGQHQQKQQDIDEEIRRLEAELATDSDSDDGSSTSSASSSSASSGGGGGEGSGGDGDETRRVAEAASAAAAESSAKETGLLCLSSISTKDRIEGLPKSCLPTSKKRLLAVDRSGGEVNAKREKKKRKAQRQPDVGDDRGGINNAGLERAVREVLDGYVARSSERLPFYCRVCAVQSSNEGEFNEHRQTEFHLRAAEAERKLSYCKLCRKQLTSPVQLKEHLKSKPHRERLERCRRSSGDGGGNCVGGGRFQSGSRNNNSNCVRGGNRRGGPPSLSGRGRDGMSRW